MTKQQEAPTKTETRRPRRKRSKPASRKGSRKEAQNGTNGEIEAAAVEGAEELALDIRELKNRDAASLVEMAKELRIENATNLHRRELVYRVMRAYSAQNGTLVTEGVLEKLSDGYGFLRAPDASYLPGPDDVYVSPSQIRRFNLQTGDTVCGQIRLPKASERYFALSRVDTVNDVPPEQAKTRKRFDKLTPVYPDVRLRVESPGEDISGRVLDLMVPLGKGQRGLIVSPPRSTRRRIRSRCRSSNSRCVASDACPRRKSARMRARSSSASDNTICPPRRRARR